MNRASRLSRFGSRSFALIVSLCFLALVSSLILGFILMAQQRRQVAYSGANQNNAALLARSAANILIGELRSEIASPNASTILQSNGAVATGPTATPPLVFMPKTNSYIVPEVRGTPDGAWTNVVKMSRATSADGSTSLALYTGGRPLVANAPSADTSTNSLNGRSIDDAAWRLPQLVATNAGGPLSTRWCILTRSGVQSVSDADVAKLRDPANDAYAIGRFSYIIYDEGGLLDINAAGNAMTAATNGRRAYLNQVDPGQIPGIQASALVAWRSPVSSTHPGTLFSSTNDYRSIPAGDQVFASRGDLIRYAATNSGIVSPALLPLLTTFTRELNAPSWGPTQNAIEQDPAGSSAYAYRSNQTNAAPTTVNPFTPNVRFAKPGTVTHWSANGAAITYQVAAGQPLLQRRFPLGRLNWIGPTGPQNGGTAQNIQSCFGLTWNGGNERWNYVGSLGGETAIKTLAQVAAETAPREPNFFELLQAGILSGSVGLSGSPGTITGVNTLYASAPNHIIQIGLNIIDQWTTTALPTRIFFNNNEFYGSKAIPCISKVTRTVYRPTLAGVTLHAWTEFEVWNPYNYNPASSANAPTAFQIVMTGSSTMTAHFTSGEADVTSGSTGDTLTVSDAHLLADTQDPMLLDTLRTGKGANVSGSANDVYSPGGGGSYTGIYLGSTSMSSPALTADYIYSTDPAPVEYDLKYKYPSGTWRIVQKMTVQLTTLALESYEAAVHDNLLTPNVRYQVWAILDPRTLRFGAYQDGFYTAGSYVAGAIITNYNYTLGWDATLNSKLFVTRFMSTPASFKPSTNPLPARAAYRYADNRGFGSAAVTVGGSNYVPDPYYTDLDGVQRYGDAVWPSGGAAYSNPQASINSRPQDRPFILNGPFQSVADMGYAFRDLPFKSLDFTTSRSADAGLLDLFCLNDGHSDGIVAGCIDLNTRHPEVIQAALSGTYRAALTTTPGAYSPADAKTMAASLVNLRNGTGANQGPLLNPSELATRFADTAFVTNAFPEVIKQQKEAAIRTLSSIGQTRTWNLMIDVVAQSGRYPAQAKKLSDFVAEGERRYWVHVAIDRYTGQIVDQQIEPVRN